jgi:cytokinin dehydrogenase
MKTQINRRTALKSLAGGAAVVGWSVAAQSWVTAAEASTLSYAPIPKIDGRVDIAPTGVAGYDHDFGNMVTGAPLAVLHPASVNDIVTAVKYARANKLTIAMNGQGGTGTDLESHSNYGQALAPGGINVDSRGLSQIHQISKDYAIVGAGVTWAQLTDAALARGYTPVGLTDYLHLSVGGTISVGGIGGMVQKYGLLCDTVKEIQIVTGTGELLTASPSTRSELFYAALAGGGQVGIITRAKVLLVPAPTRALWFNLYYNDLATYMSDQERILSDGRFSHQEGEIIRKPDDSGWRYKIEAVKFYTGTAPDRKALLNGLRDDRADAETTDLGYRDWLFRIDPFETYLKENGFWNQPKPWLSLVLPASKTKQFIEAVVAELTNEDLGAGFSGFYPFKTSKLTRPLFALPTPAEPTAYLFDVLRFPFPGDPGIDRMLAHGAKRYLVGAIPGMTKADWQKHFGALYAPFAAAKNKYDPDRVLTPGQGFFA